MTNTLYNASILYSERTFTVQYLYLPVCLVYVSHVCRSQRRRRRRRTAIMWNRDSPRPNRRGLNGFKVRIWEVSLKMHEGYRQRR